MHGGGRRDEKENLTTTYSQQPRLNPNESGRGRKISMIGHYHQATEVLLEANIRSKTFKEQKIEEKSLPKGEPACSRDSRHSSRRS